jgi:hypothetical protein
MTYGRVQLHQKNCCSVQIKSNDSCQTLINSKSTWQSSNYIKWAMAYFNWLKEIVVELKLNQMTPNRPQLKLWQASNKIK